MPIDLYWDHNEWYQARLLRALPVDLNEVLDVGCGAGSFAVRLAAHARHVDAIDREPHMIALARELVPQNVDVRVEDMTTAHLPPAHCDAVTSISALHHVELTQVLPRLAQTLRPGGHLLAIALPKTDPCRDLPIEALSAVGHRLLGAAFRLEEMLTGRRRYAHEANMRVMPTHNPVPTTGKSGNKPLAYCPR